ncbi:hypothetical protein [Streptomyces sp. SCL15-4]|uniref:hypothetical protein n=1 Tax=Streptomyces sp. SCL15-4 TaxID=2967221 RepID=UPI0029675214|nr:hypothetical protein [Streptomyces sp. SCL15-4]
MTQPSPDARAVAHAIDALTTQVRRIADALTLTAQQRSDATDGAPTAAPAALRDMAAILRHIDPEGFREAASCCEARAFAIEHGLAKESDDERPAPAADEEQMLRWARRESLLVLVTRVQHGRTLTADEARILRQHVETEMREAETARAELEQAQAAIERVRSLRTPFVMWRDIATALDGAEQPTTTAPQDGATP